MYQILLHFSNLDESNRKPNKIWVDKCSEFINRSMKLRLGKNTMEKYSAKYSLTVPFVKNSHI